jgi:hypothetical protein
MGFEFAAPPEPVADVDVARDPRHVLLHQGVAVGEEVDPVRREQVLELQAVHARGVRLLHVEVVLVVVVGIDDPDTEGRRIAEGAEVDPVDVEVADHREIAVDLEPGVDLLQGLVEVRHLAGVVDHGVPERRLAVFVGQRDDLVKRAQPLVGDREIALAPVAPQVAAQVGPESGNSVCAASGAEWRAGLGHGAQRGEGPRATHARMRTDSRARAGRQAGVAKPRPAAAHSAAEHDARAMNALAPGLLRWRWPAAGVALVAAFAVLAGRFWHPHYGFTRFLQIDEADHRAGVAALRAHPVFTYPGFNGYDGAAYVQLAFHPLLDAGTAAGASTACPTAPGASSAAPWPGASPAGDPARIASTYAALNLAVWLAFAGLLWRVLRVADARSWVAWAGVVFSAGALHSVRLALTDLLAATLATAALFAAERRAAARRAGPARARRARPRNRACGRGRTLARALGFAAGLGGQRPSRRRRRRAARGLDDLRADPHRALGRRLWQFLLAGRRLDREVG